MQYSSCSCITYKNEYGRQGQSNDFSCLYRPHQIYLLHVNSHRPVVDGKCRYIRFLHKTVPEHQCEQCKQGGDDDRTPLYDERRPVVDDPPHTFASQFQSSLPVVFFPFLHVGYSSIWFFTKR